MDSTTRLTIPVAIIAAALFYIHHRYALPQPIPGIPYNKESANRILGDIPLILKAHRYRWFGEMAWKHRSPLFQVFLRPFSKPLVVVADFREAQDICLRRTKEFDVGPGTTQHFKLVMPENHLTMSSQDPNYKRNKQLVRDLMTPEFLGSTAAPQIYEKAQLLLELWATKANIGQGRSFDASGDIHNYSMDIVLAVAFGLGSARAALGRYLSHVVKTADQGHVMQADGSFQFPGLPLSHELQAMLTITTSVAVAARSLLGKVGFWVRRQFSPLKEAISMKEYFIAAEMDMALDRLESGELDDTNAKCAMEKMLIREQALAEKQGRAPDYCSRAIHDELFGYLIGGLDTTSAVLQWGVKFLATHQDIQRRLRDALRSGLHTAHAEGRRPSLAELTKAHIPYLDAFVEETLRHSFPFGFFIRQTLCDTQILGAPIPKGTLLFISTNGPGLLFPEVPVDENLRSEAAQRTKLQFGTWDPDTVGQFVPDRWLKEETSNDGQQSVVFNASAGPLLNFGAGTRGCFGKRLAYLEIRITLAMLVWAFEFSEIEGLLGGLQEEVSMTRKPEKCYVKLSLAES